MTWAGQCGTPQLAMTLRHCGWKVRQVAGRRIRYKGRAGSEIVARNMDDAMNLETTLRRTKTGGFMWGQDVAELLGSVPPEASKPQNKKPHPIEVKRQNKARKALELLDSATFLSESERDLYMVVTQPAREVLAGLIRQHSSTST